MELGPEPPHRRRLLFACSPPPAPQPVVKALFSTPAAGGLSPVTSLTVTMDQLQGLGSEYEQPLEVRNSCLQRMGSSESTDSGFCLDSPGPLDSKENLENPMRRINSLPQKLLGCSPALKRSHSDSLDHDVFQLIDQDENKENLSSNERDGSEPGHFTPFFMPHSPVTATLSDEDDGFMDLLDGENLKNDEETPSCMASLWTAPLVMRRTTNLGNRCKLFDSPSTCSSTIPSTLKRPDRSQEESPRGNRKRRKSVAGASPEEAASPKKPQEILHQSLCLVSSPKGTIENILDNDPRDLIGDFSKCYLFHTVAGKHQDLKYISPEIIASVLSGKFANLIKEFVIIDCRYPYEYEGGHIKGAVNLHMEEEVEDFLLKKPIVPTDGKRVIVVFHCEFSSERGPRMCRYVRERDRLGNEYPKLHYPELYVLKGGYKEFFLKCQSHCEPPSYRPMHHEDFKEDLKKFRTKSRTWAGEKSKREMYSRLKKL
ncbi:M-phase inducer phosphatase 1 isoform X4 [Orcinus orca]|uniref:M-phase inducer phosphatase n=1 Tax=Tursiops truncatus TaxID=9739 RepID=A0A2U4CAU3_TURTR|nr:M-phase inducer phosphatase 1 isoform X4 [Orcinus orca]XP_019802496.1 M-phase inducer phosphatase 1 isoform X3 [Tursiops truncatus]XP_026952705.1 M-phase inducer phosphatase 1 isoform X4 [Lagenorhynchus obliquidens]XP_030701125.1 M-phase inducer phosphatase 1 isoform X3 [Globicephala melas]XP_060018043.1 M-phase inducer phosphatase 1 isoform X4 [Lagenorhynchus albirostris]